MVFCEVIFFLTVTLIKVGRKTDGITTEMGRFLRRGGIGILFIYWSSIGVFWKDCFLWSMANSPSRR